MRPHISRSLSGHAAHQSCEMDVPARSGAYLASLRDRSEEHTSELQSLMRNSYAVFCLKKKKSLIKSHNHKPYIYLKQLHIYHSYNTPISTQHNQYTLPSIQ